MGTPDFAVASLNALISSMYNVTGVVTQPDKPRGRGNTITYTPIKKVALENNIPVFQPKKVRDKEFIDLLRQLSPDLIIVVAFGQILPTEIINLPPLGCINVHASLLPKYRGAAPIQWAIINGELETGVTTMYMDEGCDTGDMLLKKSITIADSETSQTLHDRLSILGAEVLIQTLKDLEQGNIRREKQQDEQSTYSPIIKKELGLIDWYKSATELERLIRGLNPWPSAYTYLDDKILKVWKAKTIKLTSSEEVGTIIKITKDTFTVITGEHALEIEEVQLQGKRRMTSEDFLRGYSLKIGTKLGLG